MIIAGILSLTYLGRNYAACQSIWVNGFNQNQGTCETAALFHWGGLVAIVIGLIIVIAGIVSASGKS